MISARAFFILLYFVAVLYKEQGDMTTVTAIFSQQCLLIPRIRLSAMNTTLLIGPQTSKLPEGLSMLISIGPGFSFNDSSGRCKTNTFVVYAIHLSRLLADYGDMFFGRFCYS